MDSLQSSKKPTSRQKSAFSPFFDTTLRFQGSPQSMISFGTACYNQKHNMIIVCSSNETLQFHNATTFEPLKEREFVRLDDSVYQEIALQPGTDTYLLGGLQGFLYKYDVPKNELKALKKCESGVLGITFLNPLFYCLLLGGEFSNKLCVRNLNDNDAENIFELGKDNYTSCLHHLPHQNLLFVGSGSGWGQGSVRIYRTDRLPHLRLFSSHQAIESVRATETVRINGKEYLATACSDFAVRIWHFIKGKMRLLKVIHTESTPVSLVYLERYKMIAVACEGNYINFLRFPSLKVEETLNVSEGEKHRLFLMKDRNMLGVVNMKERVIEFIQLFHQEID